MSVIVRIDIDEDDKRTWYTNLAHIRGTVKLTLKSSVEVSSVCISLYGTSETALTRVDDFGQKFTDNVVEKCVFLNLESQLFPPKGQHYGSKYSLKEGSHSFPFAFELPMRCTDLDRRPLPPSFSDADEDLAMIKYFLRGKVEHSAPAPLRALGGSSRTTSSCIKPIIFLPSDDQSFIDSVPTFGVFHTQSSKVVSSTKTMSGLISRIVTTLAHDKTPACNNVAKFTVRSELLVTPGLKFSCVIEAISESSERLIITDLRVDLVSRTWIRAKNIEQKFESSKTIFQKSGVKLDAGDLNHQIGNPVYKLPESTPPSFQFSNVKREYRLEFKLRWTHQPSSALSHKSTLSRKIWVRSGVQVLPNYETGEVLTASRDYPQEKWYYN